MSALEIFLFGKLDVRCNGHALSALDARKVQELLCYLMLYRQRSHPRETLAALLCGEVSTSQSRSYLRKALWQLQECINCHADTPGPGLLQIEPEWIHINQTGGYWLDVDLFENAFQQVQGIPGNRLTQEQFLCLQKAISLYRGDLFEGCYQDWCLYERQRLQHAYLAILDKLVDYCETCQRYEQGLIFAEAILRSDIARERTHRCMMRLHALAGDRTAALRQYDLCAAALRQELDVLPAQRTMDLRKLIQADQFPTPAPETQPLHLIASRQAALQDNVQRLTRLEDAIGKIQQKLHNITENIQAISTDHPQT